MIEKIKIKYLVPDLLPVKEHAHGDWVDLRAAETVQMKAGSYYEIRLGVAMQLPEGYEAHLVARSSTFKSFGILMVNGMAVIDESYCGDGDEWRFPAYAVDDTVIRKNDRICQFRIMKHQPNVHYETVLQLGNPDRGGIGSTGKR